MARVGLALIASVLFAPRLDARGQEASFGPVAGAPGYFSDRHWFRDAVVQLFGLGLLDGDALAAAWPFPRDRARAMLAAAEDNAAPGAPARALAGALLDRHDAEFHRHAVGRTAWIASLSAGWSGRDDVLLAGRSVASPDGFDYTGPSRSADRSGPIAVAMFGFAAGSVASLAADIEADPDAVEVTAATLTARAGPLELWAGRRGARTGPAAAPGLVLDGEVHFDGGGFETPDGFALPGFLRALGTIRISQLFARMDRSGDIERPWFFATRVALVPGPAWSVALNRAAIFGGTGNEAVTLRRLLLLLTGITDTRDKDSDFENQVASVDIVVRPAASWLLYGEYAADDWGLAFVRVPAITVGAEYLPTELLAVGAEITGIAGRCCSYPPWYRHGALADGWSDRGRVLGHPLGGQGVQASLTLRALPEGGAGLAAGRVFVRDRGADNLFSPDREGVSAGFEARVSASLLDRLRLELTSAAERGDEWSLWVVRATAGWSF